MARILRASLIASLLGAALCNSLDGSNFVFLQKFGLGSPSYSLNLTFHTEVLVCPRSGFSADEQKALDNKIAGMTDFAEVELSWWASKTANCVELGYGGAPCSTECCSAPHSSAQINYPLNARRAVISNADVAHKELYIYGTGSFDGDVAYHHACDKKCWSNWAGTDYNILKNNCNTFTSMMLKMVYGLSEKKPHLTVSDLVTVHGSCPGTGVDDMADLAAAQLTPELTVEAEAPTLTSSQPTNGTNYVFLQRFGLGIPSPNLTFHTEVLVCPKAGFSADDQKFLDDKIAALTDFTELDLAWWSTRTAQCVELGYGGAPCVKECCGVPHGSQQQAYPLNARAAVISNADVNSKRLYAYGTGAFDGSTAFHYACDRKCWSAWSGLVYNPLTNNCNTFTSTILAMVYGLSQKKPHLTISDVITVHGHCPASEAEVDMPVAQLALEYTAAAEMVV